MTTRRRATVIVVAAVVAFGIGIASAGSDGFGYPWGGDSTAAAMMGGGMMGRAQSHMDGGMMAGQPTMRGDMGSMHAEMMAAGTGKVPAEMLANCENLHAQMMSPIGDTRSGHGGHHLDSADSG